MAVFLDWLYSAGAIVFVFVAIGFCIFSHELGHFLAAKWRGLHVDAFSIGFKAIWRKKYKGVEYRIGILPFGGYCDIPQIDATDAEPKAADGTILPHAKPPDRIITAAAGPLFNVISGFLVACVIWVWGMPQDTPKMRAIVVRTIDETGPEYAAGLRAGDRIVKLNGKRFFCTWANFTSSLLYTIGEVELTVERNGAERVVRYTPRVNPKAPRSLQHEKIAYPFFTPLVPIDLVPERGGAAERAGVKPGDRLVAIDGHAVLGYDDFQLRIDASQGKPVKLSLLRAGKQLEITVTPTPVEGLGGEFTHYLIGVNFSPEPGKVLEVAGVFPGWAAERAGIRPGDRLIAIDGEKQVDNISFTKRIRAAKETEVAVTLRRGNEELTLRMTPMKYVPMTIGAVVSVRDYPSPWQQFVNTWEASFKALRGIFVGIAHKLGFTEKSSPLSPRHLSGPLGMGMVLFNSVRHSTLSTGIYFMVLISFALAIFNLLPLPVLDGGHILFGVIEAVIRRPLPVKVVKYLYIVFATLLIMLMVYVTFFDAKRLYYNNIRPMLKDRPGAAEVQK